MNILFSLLFHSIYPKIFVLMIAIVMYGYAQPYKHAGVNVLEILLSVNTLILLLLVNTTTFQEELSIIGPLPDNGEISSCRESLGGVTDFAWLLLPVYYLPLIMFFTVGFTWISFRLIG